MSDWQNEFARCKLSDQLFQHGRVIRDLGEPDFHATIHRCGGRWRAEGNKVDIRFIQDDTENWLPGWSSDYLPQIFLTPDRRIMKKQFLGRVTYHLPETHEAVSFSDLRAVFQAAYGRPLPD